jgi:hypothetical protein
MWPEQGMKPTIRMKLFRLKLFPRWRDISSMGDLSERSQMRKTLLAALAAVAIVSAAAPANRASAMTVAAPVALGPVAADANPIQQVWWGGWHRHYWGWGWHPHYWGCCWGGWGWHRHWRYW